MSLRTAIESLPDDRDTAVAVREIVRYFSAHEGEPIGLLRIERVLGLKHEQVGTVVSALTRHFVIDCDGPDSCVFSPDSVVELEVARFLRTNIAPTTHLQRGVDRFRGRFGGGI